MFQLADVGSPQWHKQRDSINLLNIQVSPASDPITNLNSCSCARCWMNGVQACTKLVLLCPPLCQAHTNASTHSEEFVVELLVSLDRMQTLVHDLLVIEVTGLGGWGISFSASVLA